MNIRRIIVPFLVCMLSIGTLVLSPRTASAQLTFSLTSAILVGAPGELVTFSGNLVNKGPSELFLNGISFNFVGGSEAFLTGDDALGPDSVFFSQVPLSLAAAGEAGATYNGPIFAIGIAPVTPPGAYLASVTIQGGSDGGSLDSLATQNIQVVVPQSAAAPEPGTGALLGVAVIALAGSVLRNKRL